MEACTNVLQHIFGGDSIQTYPSFHTIYRQYLMHNGNILGIELMEMSTNCTAGDRATVPVEQLIMNKQVGRNFFQFL